MPAAFDADSAVGFCADCPGKPPDSCYKERRQIEKRCGVSRRENNRFVEGRERYNNRKVRPGRRRGTVQVRNMTWKDEHCGPALMQVNADTFKNRMDELRDLTDNLYNDIFDYAADLGVEMAKERAEKWLLASGGRLAASGLCTVVGPVGTGVCGVAATIVSVVSAVWSIFSGGRDFIRASQQINETLDTLTTIRNNAESILQAGSDPASLERVQRDLSNAMAAAAAADKCLSARKCYLVPYDAPSRSNPQGPASMNQAGTGSPGLFDKGLLDLSDSRGCCPGQTGHHLIPKAMLQHCSAYNADKHKQAPVVCAEGANHSMGSHGQLHDAMDDQLISKHSDGRPMTMQQAIDAAATSLASSGVGNRCRPECIKEQLERFYKNLPCTPNAVNRVGRPINPDPPTTDL